MTEAIAYIGLGANVGDTAATLRQALELLNRREDVAVHRISQFLRTKPVGGPEGQADYLNAAAEIHTTLSPPELLAAMQEVEAVLGRNRAREQRWGPRTCDLDLLLYDEVILDTPELTIPHPCMHQRGFVLGPLAQIAPEAAHPVLKKPVSQLFAELTPDN
jgi:2-amino-4-hydroxy-6-hydroxymethyldihydropteridine diphosphokinase